MGITKIIFYTTNTGKQPFFDWHTTLDKKTKAIIHTRLARVRLGNLGNCKPIKGVSGISEIKINHGAGYRIYYGRKHKAIIVLLVGGNKGSQKKDIKKAQQYWHDFKESKQ